MAITIRDIEKHEEMISELKILTNSKTASGALLDGGYAALKYKSQYDSELIRNRRLEDELNALKRKINNYLYALHELQG